MSSVKENSNEKSHLPVKIRTVGEMKKALERFEDSAMIDACYTFKRKELKDIELEQLDSEDEIIRNSL